MGKRTKHSALMPKLMEFVNIYGLEKVQMVQHELYKLSVDQINNMPKSLIEEMLKSIK